MGILLLFVGCGVSLGLCAGASFLSAWPQTRTWEVTPIPVEGPITLHVRGRVGRIVIRGGEENAVRVRVKAAVKGWPPALGRRVLDAMRVDVHREGNEVWVTARIPEFPRLHSKSLYLEMTVPRETAVDLENQVGQIRITGLQATVWVNVDVGQVTVEDVVLTGDSAVTTNVGEITFRAVLPPQGEVRLRTDVGAITAEVQRRGGVHLRADTGVGTVVLVTPEGRMEAQGHLEKDIGPQPTLELRLETGTGAITVRVREAREAEAP